MIGLIGHFSKYWHDKRHPHILKEDGTPDSNSNVPRVADASAALLKDATGVPQEICRTHGTNS